MTSPLFLTLVALQMAMGLFDILYHHELTERLAWHVSQKRELKLHAARNLIYAVLFAALGFFEPRGLFALALMALLAGEVLITLTDFVEEDRTRRLPASERVTHALLAINYGAILVMALPILWGWAGQSSALRLADRRIVSLFMALAILGLVVFAARETWASLRAGRLVLPPAWRLVSALPPRQHLLITGATGFIGSRLTQALVAAGHDVTVLARDPEKAARLGAPLKIVTDLSQIRSTARIDAVINLAGESMGGGLWTKARRRLLTGSRLEMTRAVVDLLERLERRPAVLINASAIGWYGLYEDEALTEESTGHDCFCRDICVAWEKEAHRAELFGIRVVALRIGLVLGTQGGLLAQLLLPFEFGAGGPIGNGHQWMSWIERDDLIRLIAHVIATPSLQGPVNATAPEPARNRDFGKALGRALHRPSLLPLPAAPLRLLAGDFARELLLGGQRVLPKKALASGFVFDHSKLDETLRRLVGD